MKYIHKCMHVQTDRKIVSKNTPKIKNIMKESNLNAEREYNDILRRNSEFLPCRELDDAAEACCNEYKCSI